MVATLFQLYNAVLRWKSLLRMVSCNVALKRRRRGRDNRELKQRRGRRQQERQKSNWFRLAKQQLCTCITPFCTFLCRRCTTTTWKCLISRFDEDVKTRQRLSPSFPELCSILQFDSRKFVNIWRIERVGKSAIMFEVARIHFLSDVFVVFAVVFAEAPKWILKYLYTGANNFSSFCIVHVRYIEILTWLRGCRVIFPYLVWVSLCPSLFWQWNLEIFATKASEPC